MFTSNRNVFLCVPPQVVSGVLLIYGEIDTDLLTTGDRAYRHW